MLRHMSGWNVGPLVLSLLVCPALAAAQDTDGDGVLDVNDGDADNDGVVNLRESGGRNPGADHDADGVPDWRDPDAPGFVDANGDGTDDRLDPDGDAIPNHLDLDSDGDGIPDLLEAASGDIDEDGDGRADDDTDEDGDGIVASVDGDDFNAGVRTSRFPESDRDRDTRPDFLDLDSDGDTVGDAIEGHDVDGDGEPDVEPSGEDADGDGLDDAYDVDQGGRRAPIPDSSRTRVPDFRDPDDDADSIATIDEVRDMETFGRDVDGDGLVNYRDLDADGDGVNDGIDGAVDRDGDGIPEYLDTRVTADRDDDGVGDDVECPSEPCMDSDGDGLPDIDDPDDDSDGLTTRSERPGNASIDTDSDGVPDYLDPDDDGDGLTTRSERPDGRSLDRNADGVPNHLDEDDDGDTVPTLRELQDGLPFDTDADSQPDHLDEDDDGDGILTEIEAAHALMFGEDPDGDGLPSWRDEDSDEDGLSDRREGTDDEDGDGVPEYLDASGIAGTALLGGANCAASPARTGAPALALLLLLLAVFARRRGAALLLALGVLASAGAAQAQGRIAMDHFRAAETQEDGFVVSRPVAHGHLTYGGWLAVDYANDPLVFARIAGPDVDLARVVEHHAVLTLGAHASFLDRIVVFGGIPIHAVMSGDDDGAATFGQPVADGSGAGDVFLGARVRLAGAEDSGGALALQVTGHFPSAGSDQSLRGEAGVVGHPELLFELRAGATKLVFNAGVRFREDQSLARLEVGDELTWGVGVLAPLVDADPVGLEARLEAWGETPLDDFGSRDGSPVEALIGLALKTDFGLEVGAAGGLGLQRGYGAPDGRFVFTAGYAAPVPREPEEEDAPTVEEPETPVAPPPSEPAGPAPRDSDGDGLPDIFDSCPDEPEDFDGDYDGDGCPEGEGFGELQPEDHPNGDPDGDGIANADDDCPNEAEDADGVQDGDGCPEEDGDGDSILDEVDACPLTQGDPNATDPVCNGCPAMACRAPDGQIRLGGTIDFRRGTDVLEIASEPVLHSIQRVLWSEDVARVRIESHTHDRGNADDNMGMSMTRASAVARWLSEHGIDMNRLQAWGCGENLPIASGRSATARRQNERIEVWIVEPAPQSGAREPEGCEQLELMTWEE